MPKIEFSLAYLKERFDYDPDSGLFRTRRPVGKGQPVPCGSVAGTKTRRGYVRICIDGRAYMAHRLAWFYMHGCEPPHDTDHINGIRDDNRIANLRPATRQENTQHRTKPNSNSTHGRNVTFRPRQGWTVQVSVGGRQKVIGFHENKEDAAKQAADFRREHYFA